MRRAGAGLWLIDKPQVRSQAEALARAQYARYRDPYECMLMYLALGKKTVLQSLFRQVRIALSPFASPTQWAPTSPL